MNNAPIRILQVSGRSDEGGGPRQALTLSAGLKDAHHFYAAMPQHGVYWDRFGGVVGTDRMIHIDQQSSDPRQAGRLAQFIHHHQIDLVHTHGQAAGLVGRLAATASQIPAVHTYHGLHFEVASHRRSRRLLRATVRNAERVLSLQTTASIAVSRSEAELIHQRKLSLRGRSLFTIPNGVPVPPVTATDIEKRAPRNGQLRVALVLRANQQKNPEAALDVVSQLNGHDALESFEVACPRLDRNQLLVLIKSKGLEPKLRALGPLESCQPLFAGSHLFVSASRWEGLPLAALEAMAQATPIAVSGVLGHVDLFDPRQPLGCTLLPPDGVDRANPEILALATAAMWQKAARQAHTNANQRFSVDTMIDRTNDVYHLAVRSTR